VQEASIRLRADGSNSFQEYSGRIKPPSVFLKERLRFSSLQDVGRHPDRHLDADVAHERSRLGPKCHLAPTSTRSLLREVGYGLNRGLPATKQSGTSQSEAPEVPNQIPGPEARHPKHWREMQEICGPIGRDLMS